MVDEQDYGAHLQVAIQVAKDAGVLFLADMHRDGGPRGHGGKAPADEEAETLIRDALEEAFPSHGIIGEELAHRNRKPQGEETHTWWLDPNDGTSAFIRGFRGASVSIGLERDGTPVLGVVFAYASPDDDGDLIAWAKGQPLTRNGEPIERAPWPTELTSDVVVALSQDADKVSSVNAKLVDPARYIPATGIAYRLALVAVGDADVGVSLGGPQRWDCAAAHALLLANGGELYDLSGKVLRYNEPWCTDLIGGAPDLCAVLKDRPWRDVFGSSKEFETGVFRDLDLSWPAPGAHFRDAGILRRAQGALLGQLAGDALGQLVEFQTAEKISTKYPDGVRNLHDGGAFNTIAGQPTDDSEMALALARSLTHHGAYDADAVAGAYAKWFNSGPFDFGGTTQTALNPAVRALENGGSIKRVRET